MRPAGAALAVAAASVAALWGCGSGTHSAGTAAPASQAPDSGKFAAEQDAEQLLGLLPLPPGARPVPAQQSLGGFGLHERPADRPPAGAIAATRQAWWRVPQQLEVVRTWITMHPPAGVNSSAAGAHSSDAGERPSASARTRSVAFAAFSWGPVGKLSARSLVVHLAPWKAGSTLLRAESQSAWSARVSPQVAVALRAQRIRHCLRSAGFVVTGGPAPPTADSNSPDYELVAGAAREKPAFIAFYAEARRADRVAPALRRNAKRFGGVVARHGAITVIWAAPPTAGSRRGLDGCVAG
jgi:hypothetical protein